MRVKSFATILALSLAASILSGCANQDSIQTKYVPLIPERYLIDCEIVRSKGITARDTDNALIEQHSKVELCNERLNKARELNRGGNG